MQISFLRDIQCGKVFIKALITEITVIINCRTKLEAITENCKNELLNASLQDE